MITRHIEFQHGYVLIEKVTDAKNTVKCDGAMLLTEQLSVQCAENNLNLLEPILITTYYRKHRIGGANYQVKVQARYEPDACDDLHVWVVPNFMEDEKDRKYFSDIPEIITDTAKNSITPDTMMCGGYLTFCRFHAYPLGYYKQALKAVVEGILSLIQIAWADATDETIQVLFKRPSLSSGKSNERTSL